MCQHADVSEQPPSPSDDEPVDTTRQIKRAEGVVSTQWRRAKDSVARFSNGFSFRRGLKAAQGEEVLPVRRPSQGTEPSRHGTALALGLLLVLGAGSGLLLWLVSGEPETTQTPDVAPVMTESDTDDVGLDLWR
jgi:hypothetical protein